MNDNKNWFQRLFTPGKKEQRDYIDDLNSWLGLPYGTNSTSLTTAKTMQLSAVYRCVEVITDAVASMPIEITRLTDNKGWSVDRKHPATSMLNLEPHPSMSRFTFFKTLIAKVLLDGNGFAKIHRDKSGNPIKLELITSQVTIYKRNDGTLYYGIQRGEGEEETVDGTDMIHILNFSYDGLVGVSTLTHAAQVTGLSAASEAQAKGFFAGGSNLSGILKVQGKLDKAKADAMKSSWRAAFDTDSGTPNGVAVIEAGTDFQPVKVNPKDAQMLESRKYSVQEICRFFGVSPAKAFDTSAHSYNSIEAGQLAFLTDTVQPIIEKVENELNRKLWRPSEKAITRARFDTNSLLRTDSDSQANLFLKLFQSGAYTPNEIRERLGLSMLDESGNEAFVQVNMQPLKNAINKKEK